MISTPSTPGRSRRRSRRATTLPLRGRAWWCHQGRSRQAPSSCGLTWNCTCRRAPACTAAQTQRTTPSGCDRRHRPGWCCGVLQTRRGCTRMTRRARSWSTSSTGTQRIPKPGCATLHLRTSPWPLQSFFFFFGWGHFSGPASCMEGFTVRNVTVGGAGEWGVGVQWCGRRERHGGGGQTPTALPWLSHRRDAWSMSRGAARKTLAASFSKFTGEHATRRGTSREGLRRGERETGRNPNVKVQFFCTRVPKDVI